MARMRKPGGGRRISKHIEEWIGEVRRGLVMIENEIDEIGQMGSRTKMG
jgi:hypothetical protein